MHFLCIALRCNKLKITKYPHLLLSFDQPLIKIFYSWNFDISKYKLSILIDSLCTSALSMVCFVPSILGEMYSIVGRA